MMKHYLLAFLLSATNAVISEDHTEQIVDYRCLISAAGIGPARPGQTLAEFRQSIREAFPEGTGFDLIADYRADFSGLSVTLDDIPLLTAAVPRGEQGNDSARIVFIETASPLFRTREGVGPGTSLKTVEGAYGPIRLGHNTEVESSEIIAFEGYLAPPGNLGMSPALPTLEKSPMAGIYDSGEPDSSYRETKIYHHMAFVKSIHVTDPVSGIRLRREQLDTDRSQWEKKEATPGDGVELTGWFDSAGVLQVLRYAAIQEQVEYFLDDGELVLVVDTDHFEAEDGFAFNEYQRFYAGNVLVATFESSPTKSRRVNNEKETENTAATLRKWEGILRGNNPSESQE